MIGELESLLRAPAAPEAIVSAAVVVPVERARAVALRLPLDLAWDSAADESWRGSEDAVRVEIRGKEPIAGVRLGAAAAFDRLEDRRAPDAPPARFFGGIAFAAETPMSAPWSEFAGASFGLPRWIAGVSNGIGFVRLTLRGSELERDRDALLAELLAFDRPETVRTSARAELRVLPPAADSYRRSVSDALLRIRDGELEKVVAAAVCHVHSDRIFHLQGVLEALGARLATSTRFAFRRGSLTFVGASPELLVKRRGSRFESDALAGTAPRVPGAAEALLESTKDRREHGFVVDAIRDALAPVARLDPSPAPSVRTLANVHHLFTPIAGEVERSAHVLDLVARLHPTPAVSGTPRRAALAWIERSEELPRGWYAGPVGWFDASGDGEFYVAIRSAVVGASEAWLYAGAGIVEGSDPVREYAEACLKHQTMLAALGDAA